MKNSELLKVLTSILSGTRQWHHREQQSYEFHPVIKEVLDKFNPTNINLLALEWPHQSLRDAGNVAFTESEQKGEADRQTVTTFGRYIRRHFPDMKDHEIRDYATKCQNDLYEIWETSDDIVRSVQLGPKSCMSWDSCYTPGSEGYDPSLLHPYRVYDPALGWKCAVRLDPVTRSINGRALVFHESSGDKVFVRTYKRGPDYSHADEALEMFLRESGYMHVDGWSEGTPIAKINHKKSFLFPYIDGEAQNVTDDSSNTLKIAYRGTYDCTSTDGTAYSACTEYCNCCEEYFDEDDMITVRDDDGYEEQVCQSCCDDNYVYAYGRRGQEAYYRENNVVETVCGENVSINFLEVNGVVEIEGNEYAFEQSVVETTDGLKFHEDYLPSGYVLINGTVYKRDKDEVFYCEDTCEWYAIAEVGDPVIVDGNTYHPEHAPETEKE